MRFRQSGSSGSLGWRGRKGWTGGKGQQDSRLLHGETREAGGSRTRGLHRLHELSVLLRRVAYFSPANASQDTFGFQFVNVPLGLVFHAQTCRV